MPEQLTDEKKLIVLLVEDDPMSAESFKAVLKQDGYDPVMLQDVKSASDWLTQHGATVCALILDVMLPPDPTALERVNKLTEERESVWDKLWLAKSEGRDEDMIKHKLDIRTLDSQIFNLIRMEGGIEIVEDYFGSEKVLELPTLYLTARNDPLVTARVRKLHAAGYMEWQQKPVERETIRQALRRVTAGQGRGC